MEPGAFRPWASLGSAEVRHAWEEVASGVCPYAYVKGDVPGGQRPPTHPGRPRKDGRTHAYASYWHSYLAAVRALSGSVWIDVSGIDGHRVRRELAVLLDGKFGTARARDLVGWALRGAAPEDPPHWWVERRQWQATKKRRAARRRS